ncbi:DNA mismatch repair protein MutS [Ethanoligenens harbinense]|uniref:DNA mismatch repair protein MutS n=1 Tax=Ethanoligenens harbinense (strain DSM 18485 / JCM 12961 / CGMCC 1.5033 / YUAN-3) TaxID=663278 RepID=E6U2G9_ETHHY|nr:DNA mismatch repair protein MutS [Ethanoligenens harbinense]ADU26260.1 DNA mismatch repair protein MutS [Ethanoligenens harbinense YUAN-3]AVQ95394.1 DNA mismatch repair protein MutS [Ethanoligenens harbinense YUAN-3]AYF38059.1 DNA mismatch repair protein MutS [Ethanoligenens harbinense]AYF40804.1 DNA mismatch repair protein MutS [Ethanoligenens harbinense]QCN91635.1 DNA mismatch repair protein MutS [Ethanoligenens harbinense]
MADMTPMMRQYMAVKEQHKDEILFFRLGDFYEMFFDDARLASRELELTLTGKDCGLDERAPMCGVPYHSCENYIARLVEKGYKVAICEQAEDPKLAKGLVKREIVRVVTPGTVIEGSMLDESRNNYLAAVCVRDGQAGVVFADVSTGEAHATLLAGEELDVKLTGELGRFAPREVLFNGGSLALAGVERFARERLGASVTQPQEEAFSPDVAPLCAQFGKPDAAALELDGKEPAVRALNALLAYLRQTQITGLERLNQLDVYSDAQFMRLDLSTRRNLELCETLRGREKRGTLLWVLDRTKTAMGKRLLRAWIEQPLLHPGPITRRLAAVDELFSDAVLREDVMEILDGVHDLERLMTRIVYGTANARELRALAETIGRLPGLKERVAPCKARLLSDIARNIDPLPDLFELITKAVEEDPPVSVREGGLIRPGYHAEIDSLREIMRGGKGFLAEVEAREKEKTGIKNLKIGYNRVFGYYIEVTKSNIAQVPEDYIRKQTLTNCERYITQELKELEGRVLGAQERVVQLEYDVFDGVRRQVAEQLHRIQSTAGALAGLDVLCSFAQAAAMNRYCRPDLGVDGRISIKDGRHPVVEAILSGVPFVPNDTELDMDGDRVAIITGPNMAGKSTYMRQVALITLMAQIGSFVPASAAHIGVVDSIFTRVGASDDLASGQSTFMVEMTEVASILENATQNSLVLLDEIGRGTSTFDGMSIARAVVEHVADLKRCGAKTLFATHYHELTVLEDQLSGVRNYSVAVKKHGEELTFLRRIIPGGADDSYGIEVAKLAGIPARVVTRAREILRELEAGQPVAVPAGRKRAAVEAAPAQMALMNPKAEDVLGRLRGIDANALTPIEALNLLFELCRIAKDDA